MRLSYGYLWGYIQMVVVLDDNHRRAEYGSTELYTPPVTWKSLILAQWPGSYNDRWLEYHIVIDFALHMYIMAKKPSSFWYPRASPQTRTTAFLFIFFLLLWNDIQLQQNCWINWDSAVLCFKRLFHIGVWTFAWFVRPLLATILCIWEIWSLCTQYITYFPVGKKKKRIAEKRRRKKTCVTAPILKPSDGDRFIVCSLTKVTWPVTKPLFFNKKKDTDLSFSPPLTKTHGWLAWICWLHRREMLSIWRSASRILDFSSSCLYSFSSLVISARRQPSSASNVILGTTLLKFFSRNIRVLHKNKYSNVL